MLVSIFYLLWLMRQPILHHLQLHQCYKVMIKTLYILQHVEILSLEVVIISECGWMERDEECRAGGLLC